MCVNTLCVFVFVSMASPSTLFEAGFLCCSLSASLAPKLSGNFYFCLQSHCRIPEIRDVC